MDWLDRHLNKVTPITVSPVYHGSQNPSLVLDKNRPVYFINNAEKAMPYADRSIMDEDLIEGEVPTIYSASIALNNPLYITSEEEYEELFQDTSDWKKVKRKGHDGIVYTPTDAEGVVYYVVFSPSSVSNLTKMQFSEVQKLIKNADTWGRAGSGILYYCKKDGTVLLLLRSGDVMDPYMWGIPGGAVKGTEGMYDDEDEMEEFNNDHLFSSANMEVEEEMRYLPTGNVIGQTSTSKGNFVYTTFIIDVSLQEKDKINSNIELNWESNDSKWFKIDDLPKNVHPGVKTAIQQFVSTQKKEGEDSRLGPCLKLSLQAIDKDPTLTLVMGPPGRKEDTAHFWVVDQDGEVVDLYPEAVSKDYPYQQGKVVDHRSIRRQLGI
jgi:8-oxo-dGTP pyrophosphatase MutT (NUDIX family)